MSRRDIVHGQVVQDEKKVAAVRLRRNQTPAEDGLWHLLRRNTLGVRFRRQQIIDGFIVDFYCHSVGLVVEVDGDVHDSQRETDADRDTVLRARGLRILRLTNEQTLRHPETALATIARLLAETPNRDSPRPLLGEGGARQRGEGVARPHLAAPIPSGTPNRDSPRPLLGEGGARQRGEGVARPHLPDRSPQRTASP
jgi:very-short-patch-repair endonuclease